MKKILLLFTSFLFTSNLTLFGADSFGAQADQRVSLLNDLSQRADELLQQASTLEGQIAEQRQGLKEPSRLRFYQELRNLWPELEEHVFVSRVAKLFVDNHISINTPTPPHWAEQDILNTLLSPESPLDSSPETKQKLKELLGKATILSDIQQKTADAEEFKKEAARLEKERKKLKKQLKKEAARLEKEAATRRAQEEAVKEAEKEKMKWDKFFGQGSKQEDQKPKTQEKQISQLVSLRAKPTSGAHQLSGPERAIRDLEKTISRLEAFKERATDQLLVQVRANYLRTLNGLGEYYFNPIITRLQEQGQLTPEVKEPLDRVIALIDAKIETANELTTQDFLAMEENALLLELDAHIQNVPGLTHPQGNLALMAFYMDWKESLKRFKHPCIPVQLL